MEFFNSRGRVVQGIYHFRYLFTSKMCLSTRVDIRPFAWLLPWETITWNMLESIINQTAKTWQFRDYVRLTVQTSSITVIFEGVINYTGNRTLFVQHLKINHSFHSFLDDGDGVTRLKLSRMYNTYDTSIVSNRIVKRTRKRGLKKIYSKVHLGLSRVETIILRFVNVTSARWWWGEE